MGKLGVEDGGENERERERQIRKGMENGEMGERERKDKNEIIIIGAQASELSGRVGSDVN